MRIYVDLDSLDLVIGPGNRSPIDQLRFKRGTAPFVQLQFLRDGVPEMLPLGTEIRFALKEQGKFDGGFVVFADDFQAPVDAAGFYMASPDINTLEINALLASPDGDDSNDVPQVELMGELTWRAEMEPPQKSNTFAAIVANSVDNGSELVPSPAGGGLFRCTLTGGGSSEEVPEFVLTKLTSFTTVGGYDPAGAYTPGSGNITVPKAGLYLLLASVTGTDPGGFYEAEIVWQINGSVNKLLGTHSRGTTVQGQAAVWLEAGDVVCIKVIHAGGDTYEYKVNTNQTWSVIQLV